jgi:Uma2 family endonuclease
MEALHEAATRSEPYISFEEFLKLYDGQHAEWLNGKVEIVVANNLKHQLIFQFLIAFFAYYLGITQRGVLLSASFSMRLVNANYAPEPDVMIILSEHTERIRQTYLEGIADIAIEIVSPESMERDYGTKFALYEKAGVPEYWLFDPIRHIAVIYVLGADKVYHPAEKDAQGRLVSTLLPGFALEPALLWRDTPPQGAELIALVQSMVE